ncbi:MAG: exodeoxyribonuclease V subunit gamma [Oscillospiraceae bacterium]|nr:exodeoxyribonuclease V subunit gamma [Oscillospiraceae bacterium]
MFTPILGRAGSGKTTYLLDVAGNLGKSGEKVIFIVPEQFSFETERMIQRRYGAKAAINIEVLSFTRLCSKVFNVCGGAAGEYADETARQLLMAAAVNELKDRLMVCKVFSKNFSSMQTLLAVVDEFKQAGITPQEVAAKSFDSSLDENLRAKLTELGEIYAVYQAMLERNYLDPADDEARCVRMLEGKNFFAEYTVIVDSFMTFTAAEYRILSKIFESAKNVYISFVCESIDHNNDGAGVFTIPIKTANRLIRSAKSARCSVASAKVLKENYSFSTPVLQVIEENLTSRKIKKCETDKSGVRLLCAADPYDEIRCAAGEINRLVREQGMCYRDIAVIARSMERFDCAVREIFPIYDIPYYMDEKEDASSIPLIAGVAAALDAACGSFDTASVIAFAKSTLLALNTEDIGQLENYCYIWNVKGSQFGKDFTANPRGMSEQFDDNDKLLLERINKTAHTAAVPLLKLKKSVKNANGKEFAAAVYEFLKDINAAENIAAWVKRSDDLSMRYLRLNSAAWSALMRTLSVFAKVMGKHTMPAQQFAELLKNALYAQKIGSVPHTQDQVLIGTADRIRPVNPKVVLVIGMNDGVFPAPAVQGGMFTEIERQSLINNGLELSSPASEKSCFEAYYVYFALTAASHYLSVSWHGSLLNGEQQKPSEPVRKLKQVFDDDIVFSSKLPAEYFISNEESLVRETGRHLRENTSLSASLAKAVRIAGENEKIDGMLDGINGKKLNIQNKQLAKELFGSSMKVSPSRIEEYHRCPFGFFCNSGLKLRPLRKVEFSALESGNAIHFVLEKLLSENNINDFVKMEEDKLRLRIGELLEEYMSLQLINMDDVNKRFKYLFKRLENSVTRLVMHLAEEFSQCSFIPCAFELDIKSSSDISPVIIKCDDGSEVEIIGKIDRVDAMKAGNDKYIRVVDYKSGKKSFRLSDVYYGLNLQMLVYLFSIWKNGKNEFQNIYPAGILYMPSGDKIVSIHRNADDSEVESERDKHYRMSGLLLENSVVIKGMEKEAKGKYIPATISKKEGTIGVKSSVANLAQMGILSDYINSLVKKMAENLHKGNVAPKPVSGGGYEPCDYCDYKSVCGHEVCDEYKKIEVLNKDEMFQLINENEESDGDC